MFWHDFNMKNPGQVKLGISENVEKRKDEDEDVRVFHKTVYDDSEYTYTPNCWQCQSYGYGFGIKH